MKDGGKFERNRITGGWVVYDSTNSPIFRGDEQVQ